MPRTTHLFLLTVTTAALASCYGPEPRPFAGRGGRSLDQPPRYGDENRYVEPIAPAPDSAAFPTAPIDPRLEIPGGAQTPPATTPGVDGGLVVTPPAPGGSATVTTPPTGTTPTTPTTPTPPAATGDTPFARSVPGKPGFVYSPKDPKKIISVEGLRPGQKARDPETGDIFRVPY